MFNFQEIIAITPTGALGWGKAGEKSFEEGLKRNPHFIAADAGSWDSGPYYVGKELEHSPREWIQHDVEMMLLAARERNIPLIIGGAGGNGTRGQLEGTVEMVKKIASENNIKFRMGIIDAQLEKEYLKKKLNEGKIEGLGFERDLTWQDVERSSIITAQMGVEPIIKALDEGAEVIIAGRSCDDALFAAIPIKEGFDPGLALHMGKILECAALSAVPESVKETMIGSIRKDHFLVEPAEQKMRCTVESIAAHSLYERANPFIQAGPGGVNDFRDCKFEQYSERIVKVTGSKFIKDDLYKVKLEGVAWIGYRTVGLLGLRDPIMIEKIDDILNDWKELIKENYSNYGKDYRINFHLYGKNAVMGALEPEYNSTPHELALVTEVLGKTQELSSSICKFFQHGLLFYPYEGQKTTAGNIAHLYSVETWDVEEAYEISVDHLLVLNNPCECFKINIVNI